MLTVIVLVCHPIYPADLIRDIKDPEHPNTLEELNVVSENSISVEYRTAVNEVRGAECSASLTTSSDDTQHGNN